MQCVLQFLTVFCSVLQEQLRPGELYTGMIRVSVLQCAAVCCSVLQRVLQFLSVYCSMLQRVAVRGFMEPLDRGSASQVKRKGLRCEKISRL